ncbi:MAG: hypothetical protein ACK4NH_09495 [Gemmobacter sp.]
MTMVRDIVLEGHAGISDYVPGDIEPEVLGHLQVIVDADLPMVARTYGQTATHTSFGAVVADWMMAAG